MSVFTVQYQRVRLFNRAVICNSVYKFTLHSNFNKNDIEKIIDIILVTHKFLEEVMKKVSISVIIGILIFIVCIAIIAAMWSPSSSREVVVYTSVDQVFSEPILKQFQSDTGIVVKPVFDVEAAKTTGLVNRLIAEKENPRADIFWSGEFAQTILLKESDVLTPYFPSNASDIPDNYKDAEGYWTGTGGRARIFLVNTAGIPSDVIPENLNDMLSGKISPEKIGIAQPLFGTTSTQAAALYAYLGEEKARSFFQSIKDTGVRVVDGNSVVRDMVVRGELVYGLTDTDDACMILDENPDLRIIVPDQKEGEMGTLVIPNTVALIKGGSNPSEAQELADYLVSKEAEVDFIKRGWIQFSLREEVKPATCMENKLVKGMDLSLEEIYQYFSPSKDDLSKIFIQ